MTAIQSLSELVHRMTGGSSGTPENVFFFKAPYRDGLIDTWATGLMYSCWLYEGLPGPGAVPTAVAALNNTTAGAIPFTNPGGGRQKWLVQAQAIAGTTTSSNIIAIYLYDRLLQCGGLSGTTITAQTVGGAITRNTGGLGNQIMIEISTAVGSTARTITASYTNQDGTSGRTSQAATIGGAVGTRGNDANLLITLPLQAGDTGVRSVEDVTVSASTGTAGDFAVVIAKPIAWLPLGVRLSASRDFTVGVSGMPEIESGACISTALIAGSTTESQFNAMMAMVEA